VRKTGPVSRVAIDETPDRVSGLDRALEVQHGGFVGVKIAECAQRFNALMKPGLEAVDRAGRSGVRNGQCRRSRSGPLPTHRKAPAQRIDINANDLH
jgi:hypothetical protein